MTRQCPSCGGICKRSVCERANVEVNLMNAEPVARLRFYKGEVVVTKDYETVERNGEFDVYTHPTPAVVQQLVEALSRMTSVFLDTEGSYGSYETDAIEFAEQALAAVKENGL